MQAPILHSVTRVTQLVHSRRAATTIEYGLIAAGMAAAVLMFINELGDLILEVITNAVDIITNI